MELVIAVAFHPVILLVLSAYAGAFAIAGNPAAVLKVAPADRTPLAHSLAFYRSPRALVCPLLLWLAAVLGAALFGFFEFPRQSESWSGLLWMFSGLGLVFYLHSKAESRLMRDFLANLPPDPDRKEPS